MSLLLLNIAIIIFGGGLSAFLVLRFFYKGSILFHVGIYIIAYALLVAVISRIGQEYKGLITFVIAIPIAIVGLVVIFRLLNIRIKTPLMKINATFDYLKNGELLKVEKITIKRKDEFGNVSNSANQLIDNLTKMASFAKSIGEGNLDVGFEASSEGDVLGNSLINMQKSLQEAKIQEDKRKGDDKKQFWVNEGHARFGELLREKQDTDSDLYTRIISELIKYIDANQGGLYILNDDEKDNQFIELVGMYAYDRKKYINQKFDVGDSLIGQCMLEGETIFMTDLPNDYINITSGLGSANPKSLLLVPLKFNELVLGVIELASFKMIEDYQIEFTEKLGESIASTISAYRINEKTIQLLGDSKMQSEELAAQEEEIRQNMEELQTTQEESTRRENEMKVVVEAINKSSLNAVINMDGVILDINEAYCDVIGKSQTELEGREWLSIYNANEKSFKEIVDIISVSDIYKREIELYNGERILEVFTIMSETDMGEAKVFNIAIKIV